ncbi:MAG: ATP-binding protein [Bacteroidota bacterium]|nr:ATP-binding protein [Bacteroidota bacterium]
MEEIIVRQKYLKKTAPFINKPIIKVFTGQRRIGKSYIMLQTIDQIKEQYPDGNFIYINKENPEFEFIKTNSDLLEYIKDQRDPGHKNFIFIDEIQEIADFEKSMRGLLTDRSNDLYCTGSNSSLLSGEIATMLSGRYVEIPVYGLSYMEFLQFHNLNENSESLLKYITTGGMPFLIHLDDKPGIRLEYLKNVLNTILFKDVVQRFNVRNYSFLNNLVNYLADNSGSLVSANRINDFLKSQKTAVSTRSVIDYLHFIESSYFIYKANRYDITGRKIFEINDKYYFEDIGLQHVLRPYDPARLHKYIEGLVYHHLIDSGFKVYVGKLADKEIDFVASKGEQTIYIQVALNVIDKKTFEREFGNLLLIKDNYTKYVVTLDEFATGNHKGIKHHSLRNFLLMEDFA